MHITQDSDWILVGTAIAIIEKMVKADRNVLADIHDGRMRQTIQELYDIYQTLPDSPKLNLKIPRSTCPRERPFLQNNIELVVHHALILPKFDLKTSDINKCFKHLNNCYWCFIIYGEIFKGYYHGGNHEDLK